MTSQPGKSNPNYKHGFATGRKHPLYIVFYNMMSRCYNPNNTKYYRYGGRGIKVCEQWKNKENFFKWALDSGWKEGLSIDRIFLDGNYEPKNCQWISISNNSRKKSTTKLTFEQGAEIRKRLENGECEYKLAEEYKVVHGTIWFIKNNFIHLREEGESHRKQKEYRMRNKKLLRPKNS